MNSSSLSCRPAARLALLFIAGILVSAMARGDPLLLVICVLVNALLIAVLAVRGISFHFAFLVSFHMLVVLLGWLAGAERLRQLERDILHPGIEGEHILLEGRIESEPARKGTRSEMVVHAERVERGNTSERIASRILVQALKSARWVHADSLKVGDAVRVSGFLEALPGARNPGEFDYGRYLALNGIRAFVVVRDSCLIERTERAAAFSLSGFIAESQKTIYGIFDRYHASEEAAYLKGVVFGYRGDLSAEVKQSFMDTGTIHILAVSGSNVVVVALIFASIVGFVRVSRRISMVLTFAGLLWYMVITGMSPSVIRATIMGCAVLGGSLLGRKGDVYNSLSVAALVMLVWDPLYLFDVGFQLSFAAVIAIVYLYPKLWTLMSRIPCTLLRWKTVEAGLQLFAVSLAAQLGTLPFTAFYFGRVSLISLAANLLVVPVSGINVLLGFATVASSFVSDSLALSYAALDDLLVAWLLRFVLWCSKVPFAYMETMATGGMFALCYYVAVAALFNFYKPRVTARLIVTGLVIANFSLYRSVLVQPVPTLVMTVLDVGQGDAILVELPNRRTVLVDTGPTSQFSDAGTRTIAPLLKRKGIASLDALILTHPHDDHIGGCRYLLENFKPGLLIVPDTTPVNQAFGDLLARARELDIRIHLPRTGESLQFDPTTRIFVLHSAPESRPRDLNDQSIVLKIVFGSATALLTGDASVRVEDQVIRTWGPFLTSDVVKVAHHGATTSSSVSFIEATSPSLALISVGRANRFNHPSPIILARYASSNIEVRRTDLEGALMLSSSGEEIRIQTWRRTERIPLL